VGVFLSVDTQEGNAQGVNPYGYVRENPETWTDPTGERVTGCIPGRQGCGVPSGPPTAGGSPTQTPTSGGCDAGMHPRPGDGMCVHDGSNCPADMQSGKGGCVYSSGECQGLTIKGCDTGRQRQHADLDSWKHILAGLQIAFGLGSLVFDIILAIREFGKNLIKAIGHILDALGDIGNILSAIASAFNLKGLNVIADAVSTFVNILAGAYQLAINTPWGIAILGGAAGFFVKLFFGMNATGILINISAALMFQLLKRDIVAGGKSAFMDFAKATLSAVQWHIDTLSNETVAQYCAGTCD